MNFTWKEFTFGTDYHLDAPNEIKIGDDVDITSKYTWFLGDIWDAINCKKSRVKFVLEKITGLLKMMGERFVGDNHDYLIRGEVGKPRMIPNTKTLVMGGSQLFWDEDRLHDYTSKEYGAGFVKRQIWVRMLMLISKFASDKVSDVAFTRAFNYAIEFGADEVIAGHKHPTKVLIRSIEGFTLKVLPRGTTKLMVKVYG